jgi:hypothetical protein
MNKKIIDQDVFYTLAWSPIYEYDKYNAMRILPELSGILNLCYQRGSEFKNILYFACWRDGCRVGLKKLLDSSITAHRELTDQIDVEKLYYRYTVVDTNPKDMQDILFWLIQTHNSELNALNSLKDSQRYRNIAVKEMDLSSNDVVERLPRR